MIYTGQVRTIDALSGTCNDLVNDYELVEGKKSNSSSPSDIYIARLKSVDKLDPNNRFVIKLFINSYTVNGVKSDANNIAMLWETRYYQLVTDMYVNKETPNVVPILNYKIACSPGNIARFVGKSHTHEFARNLAIMYASEVGISLPSLPGVPSRPAITDKYPSNKNDVNTVEALFDSGALSRRKMTDSFLNHIVGVQSAAYMLKNNGINITDVVKNLGFMLTPAVTNNSSDPTFSLLDGGLNTGTQCGAFFTYHDYMVEFGKVYMRNIQNSSVIKELEVQFYLNLMQILFTIASFEANGFNHNDLHCSNILMSNRFEVEKEISVYYYMGSTYFISDATIIPRIFDFDRSTQHSNPNLSLEPYLIEYGQVREFTRKRDTLKVISLVLVNLRSSGLDDIADVIESCTFKHKTLADKVNKKQILENIENGNLFHTVGSASLLNEESTMISVRKTTEIILELHQHADVVIMFEDDEVDAYRLTI